MRRVSRHTQSKGLSVKLKRCLGSSSSSASSPATSSSFSSASSQSSSRSSSSSASQSSFPSNPAASSAPPPPTTTPTIDYPTLLTSPCAHRRAIAHKNGVINAFVAVSAEPDTSHSQRSDGTSPLSESEAKSEEDGNDERPLRGLTIGIKDNIATKAFRTTCSSGILANYTSPFDSTVISLLHTSGADVIGKTNCDEFGMGSMNKYTIHGVVVNPFGVGREGAKEDAPIAGEERSTTTNHEDTARSAGGSSGGSAAAVAAGMCDVALGTDTGGSIRLPASYCGVVGYKPSYGLISRFGVVSYADSLDCVGVLGRDVGVVERVGDVLAKEDNRDPTSAPGEIRDMAREATEKRWGDIESGKRKLRVGVPKEYFPREMGEGVKGRLRKLMKKMMTKGGQNVKGGGIGVEFVPISLPSTPYALSAYYVIASAEASSNLARYDGVRYGVYVKPPRMGLDEMIKAAGGVGVGEGGRSAADVYAYSRSGGFGEEVRKRIVLGSYALSAGAFDNYFLQAQRVRQLVRDDFGRVFGMKDYYHASEYPSPSPSSSSPSQNSPSTHPTLPPTHPNVDVIMHLSSMRTAPRLSEDKDLDSYVQDVLTVPASLARLPALSVPLECVGDEWPLGVSVVGQWGSDGLVFRVGGMVQALEGL
ncbi:hypothetical protein CVT24_010392 [Panaeolus cyanescens]|uniref:Glutamyl-tRNA(Gln) amidotransferase subunit A, mitochondrial n=1 Tax=Panaeolus cyanescens TaxID=181874 RepID=A0A409WCK7_9AGAR|nr:hypothetical protein CVT24_010392 [Panaeolus cyanescens]